MQQNFFGHLRQFLWELLNVFLREEWRLYKPTDKETISVWGTEQDDWFPCLHERDSHRGVAEPGLPPDSRGVVTTWLGMIVCTMVTNICDSFEPHFFFYFVCKS